MVENGRLYTVTLRAIVVLIKTLDSVATFCLLLVLFIFIFSVLGMHLFGGSFCTLEAFNITSHQQFDMKCRCCTCGELNMLKNSTDIKDVTCKQERSNFDSLHSALLTVFQILTQEDWNEVLYNGMEKTGPWSAIYFILLMIFGNYVLLNLLVAILVESFQNEKENNINNSNISMDKLNKSNPFTTQATLTGNIQTPENTHELTSNDPQQDTLTGTIHCTNSDPSLSPQYFTICEGNSITKHRPTTNNSSYSLNQNVLTNISQTSKQQEKDDKHIESNINNTRQLSIGTQLPINDQNEIEIDTSNADNIQHGLTTQKSGIIQSCLNRLCGQRILEYFEKRENYSLYLFSPSNRFRKVLQRLIRKKSFDYLILLFIGLNCITLAMERPSILPNSFERKFLIYTNYIFTAVFTIEMIIKVIASGFIFGSNTYLHTGWNIIDGIVVLVSIIDISTMHRHNMTSSIESDRTPHILSMLRVFRLLRALRPLTVINRAPGLKLVVQTLVSSLKTIGQIIIICCVVFIIFGILGVQLFKGKFYYCEGPLADSIKTRKECESMFDHQWQNQQYNFDNLIQALLTLFVLSSKDGWMQIMYNGIDAVDVDIQPIRDYSQGKIFYFVSFILIVGFFVLNMFVGAIIDNFHECHAKLEVEREARNKEKLEKKLKHKQQLIHELQYYANFSSCRKCLYNLCTNKYFDLSIAIIIGLNVLTMSFEYYRMPSALEKFLEYCNYIFTGVFLIEFILKVIALGPSRYFKEKWNQLDSFIVFVSIASIILEKFKSGHFLPINPTIIRAIRILRIARVLKLLKMAKGVRVLLDTVIRALPQTGNLGLLFFLIFFIFATLGVELFGKLECNQQQPCSALDKHANFKNFGISLLTLFRIATGDNWNSIMKDTLRQDDSSSSGKNYFLTIISPIYFVAFVLATQFILLNIVVAVLMKELEDSNKMTHDDDEIDEENEHKHAPDQNNEEKVTFTKL